MTYETVYKASDTKEIPGVMLDFIKTSIQCDQRYAIGNNYKNGVIKAHYPNGMLVQFHKINAFGEVYKSTSFYTYQDVFFGFTSSDYKPTKEYGKI